MPIANTKIVQAYIQALIEAVILIQQADSVAQKYKTKFIALNPNLTGTNITQAQINAVNNFINDLHSLAVSQVATVVKSKDIPSHGKSLLG